MARKGLLDGVMGAEPSPEQRKSRAGYALTGASKSMKMSIDDMAESARRLADGETVVKIDTSKIEVSFLRDRMSEDDQAFDDLKAMIAEHGQETPVLLKPHPDAKDRYMVVFGHRRVRAARALGMSVRAVVREIDDTTHVIAQGQENSAREDLSFIEKALYAKSVVDQGFSKEVAMAALTIDATLLSRMLSIAQKVPAKVTSAIGTAKGVGRDRWEELKKLVVLPANHKKVASVLITEEFKSASSDGRFELILGELKTKRASSKPSRKKATKTHEWEGGQGRIKALLSQTPKAFNISLKSADALDFGEYLSDNLDQLYRTFREHTKKRS